MYYKMLRNLEVRRIGVRGGLMPFGRLIRVELGSLLRLPGEPDPPSQELPRWVTIKQAAEHYQVSPKLIRMLIAHQQLDARRIGGTKAIRLIANLCCNWADSEPGQHRDTALRHHRGSRRVLADQ
jgi:hypothetical protein